MLLKCERCGAPLEVPAGGSVRCVYCGTTSSAPMPASPGGHGYGPAGHGHYPASAQVPSGSAKRSQWAVILIVLAIALAGSASFALSIIPRLVSSSGSPAIQKAFSEVGGGSLPKLPTLPTLPRSPALSTSSWSAAEPGCLLDANGDGVLDIAGLTGASEPNQPTVVDGNSGQVLFQAPALAKAVQLGCLGELGFFVVEGNFQVDFFTARRPWGKTSVMARDKVSAYGVGQGCVQLRTDDGTTQGIQLPSGVATTCPATTMRRYYGFDEPGLMGLTDKSTELTVGPRKYRMTVRASGTEILTVRMSEGGKEVWAKELPYATCTFGAGLAVGSGKILLWAAQPAERSKGLLIGLDEATGTQAYEIAVPDSVSNSPDFFAFNGKYVLAVNWGALRAYQPATGAEAWRVGR